ncbi:hypothetical protein K7432_013699 [Basidiobolus ranarum]|uniref:Protein kinase domain-containing protein n=1 Tax=Basidiobolus ranarum TaxID=34480 RepID=A0ABR2WIZ7_9FUNG
MDRYEIIRELDKGTYGTVLQARDRKTGEIVAIKKIKNHFANWKDCLTLRELKVLRKLSHPNIVRLYNAFVRRNKLFLVFEFMDKNLYNFIQEQNGNLIEENRIQSIMFQILNGLDYMHRKGYFHRDVKPENILMKDDIVKTADFGLVREIKSTPPYTDYVSTRWYRAPEVLLGALDYSAPIDIWAAGAIMAELYTLRPLFPGQSEIDQIIKICLILGTPDTTDPKYSWDEGVRLASRIGFQFPNMKTVSLSHVIPNASSEAIHLMSSMLRFDPKTRLNARQALRHPYFTRVRRSSLSRLSLFDRYSQASYQKLLENNPFRRFSKEIESMPPSFGSLEHNISLLDYPQSNSLDTSNYTPELVLPEIPLLPHLDHYNIDSTADSSLLFFDVGKFVNCWKRDIGYPDSTSNSTDPDLFEAKQAFSISNSQNTIKSSPSLDAADDIPVNIAGINANSEHRDLSFSTGANTMSTPFQAKFDLGPPKKTDYQGLSSHADIPTQDLTLNVGSFISSSNPGRELQNSFEKTQLESQRETLDMSIHHSSERNIELLIHEVEDVSQETELQASILATPEMYSRSVPGRADAQARKSSASFSRLFNWARYS